MTMTITSTSSPSTHTPTPPPTPPATGPEALLLPAWTGGGTGTGKREHRMVLQPAGDEEGAVELPAQLFRQTKEGRPIFVRKMTPCVQ